ncbi:hypothetical protein CP082626L3_0267B, partial [Chlamydia psittaci 08-2626_L3]
INLVSDILKSPVLVFFVR